MPDLNQNIRYTVVEADRLDDVEHSLVVAQYFNVGLILAVALLAVAMFGMWRSNDRRWQTETEGLRASLRELDRDASAVAENIGRVLGVAQGHVNMLMATLAQARQDVPRNDSPN